MDRYINTGLDKIGTPPEFNNPDFTIKTANLSSVLQMKGSPFKCSHRTTEFMEVLKIPGNNQRRRLSSCNRSDKKGSVFLPDLSREATTKRRSLVFHVSIPSFL